ncbi:MAG: DUF6364 family protein [Bacteroidota bacterium]
MTTKLTLTLNDQVIKEAKQYAASEGKSLSEMVENYFKYLTGKRIEATKKDQSSRVSKLKGIMNVDHNFDYKAVLEAERSKKHGV